jgi:hypothetical protein
MAGIGLRCIGMAWAPRLVRGLQLVDGAGAIAPRTWPSAWSTLLCENRLQYAGMHRCALDRRRRWHDFSYVTLLGTADGLKSSMDQS